MAETASCYCYFDRTGRAKTEQGSADVWEGERDEWAWVDFYSSYTLNFTSTKHSYVAENSRNKVALYKLKLGVNWLRK